MTEGMVSERGEITGVVYMGYQSSTFFDGSRQDNYAAGFKLV